MLSIRRSILLSPLFLLLAAASLSAQGQETKPTQTVKLKLENNAHCDTDVRITQDGRAVVSRAVIEQLGSKTISVELSDNSSLRVNVQGRNCHINYAVDVPPYRGNSLVIEIGDTPSMLVARR